MDEKQKRLIYRIEKASEEKVTNGEQSYFDYLRLLSDEINSPEMRAAAIIGIERMSWRYDGRPNSGVPAFLLSMAQRPGAIDPEIASTIQKLHAEEQRRSRETMIELMARADRTVLKTYGLNGYFNLLEEEEGERYGFAARFFYRAIIPWKQPNYDEVAREHMDRLDRVRGIDAVPS